MGRWCTITGCIIDWVSRAIVGGLTQAEKSLLLELAREALACAVRGESFPPLDYEALSPALREKGASFVTLTKHSSLRGCIGTLEARQPLAEDVREHAAEAGLDDYRFPPVTKDELPDIHIEISRLTQPQPLDYANSNDLLRKLRPGIDGVVLRDKFRRATFLPQVWEHLPEPEDFLDQLCLKMGAERHYWRSSRLLVETYQVEEFHEE